MDGEWEYDHEYFQQMIEHDQRVNNKAVSGILTNLQEAIKRNSSSSEDRSMPGLEDRAREDLSGNEDTDSFGEVGIYNDNSEPWGYKALTLKQINGRKSGGMFPSNIPTLYTFC